MTKFVIYSDGSEVIVTTQKNEKKTLKQYFKSFYWPDRNVFDVDDVVSGNGDRNIDAYNRYEITNLNFLVSHGSMEIEGFAW
ncbi:MAG: hypothetical protein ABFD07_18045 [Methanobacterium sp.]